MRMSRLDIVVFSLAGVVALGLLGLAFQLFFRFQYVRAGAVVTRVDRLSGRTCVMPCIPTPPPGTPAPTATPPSLERQELRAIALVQRNSAALRLAGGNRDGYSWSALPAEQAVKHGAVRADEGDAFAVCYCDQDGFGPRWETHLKSAETYYVNDNRVLSYRYGARLRPKVVRTPAPIVRVVVITPTPAPVAAPVDTPAPVAAAPQSQDTPPSVDVVREYYRLWKQQNYSVMYAMLSPRFQAKLPYDIYVKYHSLVTEIQVDAQQGYVPSVVNVRIVSRDREKDGSISQTTNVGQWGLVWMGGTWKLDSQDVHEVDGSRTIVKPAYRVATDSGTVNSGTVNSGTVNAGKTNSGTTNAGGTSPSETVRRFYQLLNGGDYSSAYQMLSPGFRRGGSFESWRAGYRTTIESNANVDDSNDPSRVPVELVAKDQSDGRTITRVFRGAWSLVSDRRGGWLLDEGRLSLVRTY